MESNNEMAKYIYMILKSDLKVIWSWGFNKPTYIQNGLKFKVTGFIFKGWVHIIYNEGLDLFDIKLVSIHNIEVKTIEGVYFDDLIRVIDENVELVPNYSEVVNKANSN